MESRVVEVGSRRNPANGGEFPLITLPRGHDSAFRLLDAHAFRNAMNALIAHPLTALTVLIIVPRTPGTTLRLANVVLGQIRAGSGDLAGYLEAAIAVVLRNTDRDGALRFLDRVRGEWRRTGSGDLTIEMAEYPREEERAIDLLTADWSEIWTPIAVDGGDSDDAQAGRDPELRTGIADLQ